MTAGSPTLRGPVLTGSISTHWQITFSVKSQVPGCRVAGLPGCRVAGLPGPIGANEILARPCDLLVPAAVEGHIPASKALDRSCHIVQ